MTEDARLEIDWNCLHLLLILLQAWISSVIYTFPTLKTTWTLSDRRPSRPNVDGPCFVTSKLNVADCRDSLSTETETSPRTRRLSPDRLVTVAEVH